MSSFFTVPASQRKRKRTNASAQAETNGHRRGRRDDDSISGSDVSEDEAPTSLRNGGDPDDDDNEDDEEFENEDPAAKRVRLAEQYLANTQREVLEDGGFDAADIDQENLRRRMGERLRQDTAENKGKLYRWIADDYDWARAQRQLCKRAGMEKSITGIAIQGKFVYAATKDFQLVKLELPDAELASKGRRGFKQARVVARTRGHKDAKNAQHHHRPILCVAASEDGRFVATGGADKKLIVWEAASLSALKVFVQHRDAVTALAFQRGTNQLYSASKDRTIKIWSLNELAYVESLFGHQDEVVDVGALGQEKCVTVGARDRTARLWKVVEEAQLVFRGGGSLGSTKAIEKLKRAYGEEALHGKSLGMSYSEGSIDRVAMIDDDTFVTGSDNGSLSLWNVNKKKAVFIQPLAHGLDAALPLQHASAEQVPDETSSEESRGGRQPRWITALKAIPFSDVLVSGSWDGYIRVWKVSKDKRRLESLGAIGVQVENVDALLDEKGLSKESLLNGALKAIEVGVESQQLVRGIVNDLSIVERGERGKDGILIAAAVGKEHRLGRWKELEDAKNHVVFFRVAAKSIDGSISGDEQMLDGSVVEVADFEGFD